jgi:hypothetical protein
MADDLEKKKKLITEINALYAKLGQQNPFGELKESVEDMRFLVDLHNELKEQIYDIDGGINEMIGSWKAIVDEAKTYSNSISSSKKSLSSLSSIASSLANHYKGINSLSEKQLESLKTKFKVEKESLSQLERSLSEQLDHGDLTNKQRQEAEVLLTTITGLLIEQESVLNITENTLNEVLKRHQDISKQLGFYPKVLGGIDKMLHRLGLPEMGINKALEETYKLGQEAEISGGKFNALGTFMNQLKTNIAGAFTKANLLQFAITELALALKTSDEGAGDMAKKMNLTYTEALRVRGELGTIASISGDAVLATKGLQESYVAVGQALGSNAMLNQQDLITMTKLTKQAGFTHDELMGIEKLSLVNGKTLEQNSQEILGGAKAYASRNKLILNEKQILREVNSASASLKLSLGGSAEQVAIAASKAKQFGLNLEQAEKIAQSLLNFESSIESELSAELLTGKNLNLEKARLLALNGDIAEASAEIAKQVGTSADFAKMNVIQQEALAKAAGMNRDELAQSLMDREALAKLSAVEGATAQEKFNNLVKQVGLEEAKKRLGEEGLANQFAQQSIQERFTQSVEKLKEIFIQLSEPILQIVSPIADMVGWLVSIPGLLKTIAAGFLVIKGIQAATYAIQLATTQQKMVQGSLDAREIMMGKTKIAQLVAQATAWALMNPVGAAIGAAAAVGIGALIYSSMKDGVIDPKKGPILSGDFGSVQLDPRDKAMYGADGKIKVGTNLAGTPTATTQDNSALIAEIRAMRNELNNRPVVVHSVVKTENNDVLARGTNSANRKSYSIQ